MEGHGRVDGLGQLVKLWRNDMKLMLGVIVAVCMTSLGWLLYSYRSRTIRLLREEDYRTWLKNGGGELQVGQLDAVGANSPLVAGDSSAGCYFGLRGQIAVRFVPWSFHSEYADIITRPADENKVYIHCYNARFRTTIYSPLGVGEQWKGYP